MAAFFGCAEPTSDGLQPVELPPKSLNLSPLAPGDLAIVARETLPDQGAALLFEPGPLQERGVWDVPLKTIVRVIEPLDPRELPDMSEGDWLSIEVPPGMAIDPYDETNETTLRGVVERRTLRRAPEKEPQ